MNEGPTRRKVLIIHHSGLLGGAGRSLVDLVGALGPGFDVTVYLPSMPAELAQHFQSEGISCQTYDFRMAKIPYYSGGESLLHPRMWYYALSIPLQRGHWREVIAREDPEVVIVNSSVLAWFSRVISGRVSVLMVRETLKGRGGSPVNRILRGLRERFTLVVYLSAYDRDQDGLRRTQSMVVPDAVVPSGFEDVLGKREARRVLGVPETGIVGLFLGGSNKLKGLALLVDALSRTSVSGIHVLVAGHGPRRGRRGSWLLSAGRRYDRRVLAQLDNSAVSAKLTFVGLRDDVSTLYSASDFVVFPMTQAHQARPAFEAGFQRKPVVITDFPNIRDCVTDGVNGLVFPAGRASALAQCLDRLAGDPDLMKRLGDANEAHAQQTHNQAVAFEPLRHRLVRAISQIEAGDRSAAEQRSVR